MDHVTLHFWAHRLLSSLQENRFRHTDEAPMPPDVQKEVDSYATYAMERESFPNQEPVDDPRVL